MFWLALGICFGVLLAQGDPIGRIRARARRRAVLRSLETRHWPEE